MKQVLLLTASIFLISIVAKGQSEDNGDSVLILNLKQQLNNANGIKEVDLLNSIAWEYMWYGSDKTPSYNYADMAKRKAETLNYEKGVGYALYILAHQYTKSNKNIADSLFKIALNIGEKLNDSRLLGWSYYNKWDLTKALSYFRKAGDLDGEAEVVTWLCSEYGAWTEIKVDFSYCQRAIELADVKKKTRLSYNKWISGFAYTTLSELYTSVGDYKSALNLIDKAKNYSSQRDVYWYYASTYKEMGNIDSTLFYYEKALGSAEKNKWHVMRYAGFANQKVGNYKRAIQLLEESSKLFMQAEGEKKSNRFNWRGEIHSHLAEAYDSVGKRKDAIKNYEFALEHSSKFYQQLKVTAKPGDRYEGDRMNWMMIVSKQLSTIFGGIKKYDSSLFYLRQYIQLKETIDNKKKAWQLNMQLSNFIRAAEEEKRTGQLQLLQKDNLIKAQQIQQQSMLYKQNEIQRSLLQYNSEMKDQQLLLTNKELQIKDQGLKEQQFLRQQNETALTLLDKESRLQRQQLKQQTFFRNALLAGLLLLLAIAVLVVRFLNVKRKAEKLQDEKIKAQLQQQSSELEMQALRAQMNPHFIFNCLSSINRFVLKNETEAASDYLTRFSRLIRMVLINSQKSLIALEDELEMLRLYLDMERLRFKDSFGYNITFSNSIDAGAILLPPLILQPFCENAIWHGLMHKKGSKKLDIVISMLKNILHCTITDNGIGREKASEIKSKSAEKDKSFGLKITTNRLALLNEEHNIQTFFEINDVVENNGNAAGTKVSIKIKYKQAEKEFA